MARRTSTSYMMGIPVPTAESISDQRVTQDESNRKGASIEQEVGNRRGGIEEIASSTARQQDSAEDQYWNWRRQQDEAENTNARNSLIQSITGLFGEYGLSSLYDTIVNYVRDGYSPDAIAILLRQTPQYKERFPAMEAMARKGRAINEAQYIAYERAASGLERQYGLPSGMLGKDAVTNLLTNEVSADELEQRVVMAAAGAFQTSQEVKDTFAQYYGIGSGGLTAYFLDPAVAQPLLEKQYASSQIGAEAAMQDITVQALTAERLFEAGVSREAAREGFSNVARMGTFTQGRGDVVSQEQLISGTFENNQEALRAIERTAGSRRGQFQGGGGFAANQQGVAGLGSAATR
jgi:hypothetical protein